MIGALGQPAHCELPPGRCAIELLGGRCIVCERLVEEKQRRTGSRCSSASGTGAPQQIVAATDRATVCGAPARPLFVTGGRVFRRRLGVP